GGRRREARRRDDEAGSDRAPRRATRRRGAARADHPAHAGPGSRRGAGAGLVTMGRAAAALVCAFTVLPHVPTTSAAGITLRATLDPPQLRPGHAADLAVTASGAQDVPVPQVPAPHGVTVRYVGPSTELSIVNGHSSASITHHFSVVTQTPG